MLKRELNNTYKQVRNPNILNTKRRAMQASWLLANVDTTLDPGGVIMQKQRDRVLIVNLEDFGEMCAKYSWTHAKGIAYIECISQAPQLQSGGGVYTNPPHPRPGHTLSEIDLKGVVYFDNSWTGHNWDILSGMPDGGPPTFWTKNNHNKEDEYSTQFKKYNTKYPGRGYRVAYDKYRTYPDVLDQLISFFIRNPTGVRHVWIQGILTDKDEVYDTTRMINDLKRDIVRFAAMRNLNHPTVAKDFADYWGSAVMFSEDHAFHYSGQSPKRVPVIPWRVSNYGIRQYIGKAFPQIFPPSTFAKSMKLTVPLTTSGEIYSNYSGYVKLRPIMDTDTDLDFGYKKVGENQYMMFKIPENMHGIPIEYVDGDTLMDWPSGKFWETGDYGKHGSRSGFLMHQNLMLTSTLAITPNSVILINAGNDYFDRYPESIMGVVKVPVDVLRQHMTVRKASGNTNQPTDALQSFESQKMYVQQAQKYNKLIVDDFNEITIPGIYLAVSGAGKSTFIEKAPMDPREPLYTVEDRDFFYGCGTVVTGMHGVFGVGRSEQMLHMQLMRKINAKYEGEGIQGFDSSGHMMASVLAYRAHFLWYLEEVFINLRTNSSIYRLTMNEPRVNPYHPIQDYVNALSDIQTLNRLKPPTYPRYSSANIDICAAFVKGITAK